MAGQPREIGRLEPELRRELEAVIGSVATDEGGGASLLKVLVLAELIVANGLSRIVEIGVYRGRLMLPLARLMSLLGRGEVVGIDPYSPDAAVQRDVQLDGIDLIEWPSTVDWNGLHQEVVDAISHWGLEGRARLIRERAEDAAAAFAGSSIDMLHIDGNHDRDAVTKDVDLFLPQVAEGGLLVVDDTSWPSVRPVYESLLDKHELLFSLVEHGANLWPEDAPNDFAVLRVRKSP